MQTVLPNTDERVALVQAIEAAIDATKRQPSTEDVATALVWVAASHLAGTKAVNDRPQWFHDAAAEAFAFLRSCPAKAA